jgi:hypothetical protein
VVFEGLYSEWNAAGYDRRSDTDSGAEQLIYYTRLAIRTNEMLSVRILAAILAVTWVVCFLAFFIGCRPVSDYWRVLPSAPDCAVSCPWLGISRGLLTVFRKLWVAPFSPSQALIGSRWTRRFYLER